MTLAAVDLDFGYGPETPLIRGVSMTFEPGEMYAVTAPSGRGKSTLLYLLGLMLRPTAGHIELDGVDVSDRPDAARAHLRANEYGFVFQDSALDQTRSVIDNVVETSLYRGSERAADVQKGLALLERFDVQIRAEARPSQVSGGQAQRIALCRALLGDPSVILADEPTGNLDQGTASMVLDALRARADEGSVVVIVTHDPTVVERCSAVVEL